MPRQATTALSNRYCQARLSAAKYNSDFLTRRTAAEHLPGVTEDSLKKYELGITNPPNVVIALMADAYNAPELVSWYCATECPLGGRCRETESAPPERLLLRLYNELPKAMDAMTELAKIMDDGKVDVTEVDKFDVINTTFLEAYRRLADVMTVMDKAGKTGEF